MTYLIGAILVVLFIALVLVFRPPKQKPPEEVSPHDTRAEGPSETDDQLDLDTRYERSKADEVEEELELTLDEPDDFEEVESLPNELGEKTEELDLVDEGDLAKEVTEDKGSDEYDEDIPFIDDSESAFERKGEMAPALADIPDDYVRTDEEEPPEELAERLEFFLGTDDEELEHELAEISAEQDEDTELTEEKEESVGETVDADVEAEMVKAEDEVSPETYKSQLQEQIERLHREMKSALENRESARMAPLAVALENLCVKKADISRGFQEQQELFEKLKNVMAELKEALPGFQLETAQASLQQGEFEIVRSLLTEAAGQLSHSPKLAAAALYQWGCIENDRGDLAAAQEMFDKSSAMDEENLSSLLAAGRLARITGEYEKALPLLEKRVAAEQEQGGESVDFAIAEHELANVLIASDKEAERVEQLLSHALETMERLLGSEHPDLGPVLHDLAAYHDSAGRYEQAEPLYNKALKIVEKEYGNESPRLGATLNKLAGLYEEIEMEERSEPLYTRALQIKQKVLGENHPDIGSIMGHLANLLKMKGKYLEAEPMYRKSLEIAEAALGKDHPNLAVVLNDMAELYSEMGNEEQAEHFQERAFSLFGLPGMGDGFVEMEKDTGHDEDDDKDQTIAGS